ncbi:NAD(P)/FAD-dependent oxidoreductase [Phycicoccus sp.]|uniref:phytoene desaturase family protein n=1 Tax=Phycicoccus sp. TaxID=1902410 RepID=UPI002BBCC429|nr:NAD(P)/FAD-dependent oxidoreductase [Phycicoccus sp.]HMM94947.1 NAD(P)/FAD-dependent oxidoreductase [Phycicoccus sp.]
MELCDAVVVGAGPNGLVAAIALADAGWEVLLVEAQDTLGGAVRSAEVIAPGVVTDLFSAFYPLAAASPVIRDLGLEEHGLVWRRSPDVLAHPLPDGTCAVLHPDAEDTAERLEREAAGDGDAWLRMVEQWQRLRDPLLDALFTTFPPVRPGLRLARVLRAAEALDLARRLALPVRRLVAEEFRGREAGLLISGNAAHTDVPPDAAGSALYGWLLTMLAQDVGFPVPEGGSGRLSAAMASRFTAAGGRVLTGVAVEQVEVRGGRATGVALADGRRVGARRAVVADVSAPALFDRLLPGSAVHPRLRERMHRFEWDPSTLKVNWALSQPVPWSAPGARSAGTVHLGVDADGFVRASADLTTGRAPASPFVLFGQMAVADPTRTPPGTETAWAYTHLPRGLAHDADVLARQVEAVERAVEEVAPGFAASVTGRLVQRPEDLEAADANLDRGAINGGSSALHHQLVLRPVPGLGRPETPVAGLYLGSAAAHPGGGVHGACGWNAARAALADHGRAGVVHRALVHTAWERVLGPGRLSRR